MTDVFVAEFQKLKDEQISRIAHRDRLFHLTLILLGGGLAIAYQNRGGAMLLLLLLPAVSYIAGMSHLACNRRISAIGTFLQSVLGPKIAQTEKLQENEVFLWEAFVRNDPHRPGHIWSEEFTFFLLYVASGAGSIGLYIASVIDGSSPRPLSPMEVAGCLFDAVLMLILFIQMIGNFSSHYKAKNTILQKMFRPLLSLLVSGMAAIAVYLAVIHYGAPFVSHPGTVLQVPGLETALRLSRLEMLAVASALVAWSIGLLGVRR